MNFITVISLRVLTPSEWVSSRFRTKYAHYDMILDDFDSYFKDLWQTDGENYF